jgi:hypothetical protein
MSNLDTDATSPDPEPDGQRLATVLDRDTDIDPDAEVILKAEWHFSTGDLREELELIRTGAFDAVVFEAARENVEEITISSVSDRIVSLPFFFLNFLSTDPMPLLVAALTQDANLRFTRDTDGDVIQDLPDILHGVVLGLVLVLSVCIAYFAARAITQTRFRDSEFRSVCWHFCAPNYGSIWSWETGIR